MNFGEAAADDVVTHYSILAIARSCRMKLFRARIIGNMDQQLFARTGA